MAAIPSPAGVIAPERLIPIRSRQHRHVILLALREYGADIGRNPHAIHNRTGPSASAQDIAQGVGVLAGIVASSAAGPRGGTPITLILAPPPLGKLTGYAETFEDGMGTSARLGTRIREIALELRCEFLDTSELIVTSDIDGVHFDPPAHEVLGCAVARRIMMLSRPNQA